MTDDSRAASRPPGAVPRAHPTPHRPSPSPTIAAPRPTLTTPPKAPNRSY